MGSQTCQFLNACTLAHIFFVKTGKFCAHISISLQRIVMKLHMHSLQKHWNDFNFGQKIVSENKTVQKFLRDQNFRRLKNTVGIKF